MSTKSGSLRWLAACVHTTVTVTSGVFTGGPEGAQAGVHTTVTQWRVYRGGGA
jgi:hypothetical protein